MSVLDGKVSRARTSMRGDTSMWRELGTPNVCDALRSCGKCFQAMDAGLRPLDPECIAAGPAFTVRCFPGATWALERGIELARPGDILVVDGGGVPDVILMGGLMSLRAQQRGIAAAIIDGAVRDVDDIVSLGFPVWSRAVCPRAGTFAEIGEWQTTVVCGRLPVSPGDYIVADRVGIVAVPADMLDEVLEKAGEIHAREEAIAHHLKEGKTLAEAAQASRPVIQS